MSVHKFNMKAYFFETALLESGWQQDVRVVVDDAGRIAEVADNTEKLPDDATFGGHALIPAMANLHSHAHQRAMAGLTEARGPGSDSFWSWRELMYVLLDEMKPEHLEAIAALTYKEMLESGYASVGEFHYLHNDPKGTPYAQAGEMSERIVQAARTSGIGLTLLPVRYSQGGADGRPTGDGQRRFATSETGFANIMESASQAVRTLGPDARLGVAPHSLRAVGVDDLAALIEQYGDGPIHIHAAEQRAEVEEIQSELGASPIAWLLANAAVDERWCVIHATHMRPKETAGLADTGAVAGLCPITEANLGDGIFDGVRYLAAGGLIGIGSDSNVRISLSEELRSLEYSQRLRDRARAVLTTPGGQTGRDLYMHSLQGGARALDRRSGEIESGAWADLVAVDLNALPFLGANQEQRLDAWVFGGADHMVVREVWSAGRHVVRGGKHVHAQSIDAAYRATMRALFG
jgi:formimidoylglutamate deiminase